MFILSECILFILILLFDLNWLKYLSIILCFVYSLYQKRGYEVLLIIVFADYLLLWTENYLLGILLFVIVQCFYHWYMSSNIYFYGLLVLLIYPSLITFAICYAIMSLINLINAIKTKHWLLYPILCLGLCDICVVIQFYTHINMALLWCFYLPSQVIYTKKVSSIKMKPL